MTTRRIHVSATTGWTVYAMVLRLSDGKVFDWNTNVWAVIGSAVAPQIAMSSMVTAGAESIFGADLNMTMINNTTTGVDVMVMGVHQAGGSPAPVTDTAIGEADSFTIVNGDALGSPSATSGAKITGDVNVTSTSGNNCHVKVQFVDASGKIVLDAAATCAVDVQRDGAFDQFSISTANFGSQNANGFFEYDFTNPNFTTDIGYTALATIVSGGVTYGPVPINFVVWP